MISIPSHLLHKRPKPTTGLKLPPSQGDSGFLCGLYVHRRTCVGHDSNSTVGGGSVAVRVRWAAHQTLWLAGAGSDSDVIYFQIDEEAHGPGGRPAR